MEDIFDIPRTAMDVFDMLPEGTRCEVIGNELRMSPSPTFNHQNLLLKLVTDLNIYINSNQLGKLCVSPLDVYLDDEISVIQPDIFFIKTENLNRIERKGVIGSPDIVIEILSSNREYDMGKKLELYQRNSVLEYFIIEPDTKEVWHYLLEGEVYLQQEDSVGGFTSAVLGTSIHF